MRKWIWLFLLSAPSFAQVVNPSIISVATAPSGACTAGLPNQQVASTGVQYSCQAGTWGTVGAGAGGPPTGTAGGALGGIYPDPTVVGTINPKVDNGVVYANQYTGTDISYKVNAALADTTNCPVDGSGYQHCTIMLPASQGGAWSETVLITSPFVNLIGQGKAVSKFSCSVNGDCLRLYTLPFDPGVSAGTFQGFSLTGTGTSLGVGFHYGDIIGINLIDLGMYSFYGGNGAGFWQDNANVGNLSTGTYTERTYAQGLEANLSFIQYLFTNEILGGNTYGGNPSMGYTRILDLKMGCAAGQIGIQTEEAVQIYNSTIRATINGPSTGTAGSSVFTLGNTSQFQGELHLTGEGLFTNLFNGASGSLVTLSQDSGLSWLGNTSIPASTLGTGSSLMLGPAQGYAAGSPASLIPALIINAQNPIHGTAPSVSTLTSGTAATYTTPTGAWYLVVEMCGPGGGGAGAGTTPGNGGNGSAATTFGSLSAAAGSGAATYNGGAGGALPTTGDVNIAGGTGASAVGGAAFAVSGTGASSPFGAAGVGVTGTSATSAGANSCSGGGGAIAAVTASSGGGGGAGAWLKKTITSPTSTYTYTIGTGGAGGTLGTSGFPGGAGGAGIITVTAYFQ